MLLSSAADGQALQQNLQRRLQRARGAAAAVPLLARLIYADRHASVAPDGLVPSYRKLARWWAGLSPQARSAAVGALPGVSSGFGSELLGADAVHTGWCSGADPVHPLRPVVEAWIEAQRVLVGGGGQLQLFVDHLPSRPYCADLFSDGVVIRDRAAAVRRQHIQPSPPWLHAWLVFDVDRDGSWAAPDECGLPAPTFTLVNKKNGHAHLLYGLKVPFRTTVGRGRLGPVHLAAGVQARMVEKLGADKAYSGFLCKNPLSKRWIRLQNDVRYSLNDLAAWVGDVVPCRSPVAVGLGRNVDTFNATRYWAYRALSEYRSVGLATFVEACRARARAHTAQAHNPALHRAECAWIGRSVGRWTWERYRGAEALRRERQARRGVASGVARRAATDRRDAQIAGLLRLGFTQSDVARVVGMSRRGVGHVARRVVDGER